MRQLHAMARAVRRDRWDQTSALRADLSNMWGGNVHPDQLNPLREYERPQRDGKAIVADLVSTFVGL